MPRRTAQSIEEHKTAISSGPKGKKIDGRGKSPGSRKGIKNLKPYPKGVSGNPSGLPGTDLAALYARRFFEAHPEGIAEELAEGLKGFNAYAYGVLADRAYGKIKDKTEITGPNDGPLQMTIKIIRPTLKDLK